VPAPKAILATLAAASLLLAACGRDDEGDVRATLERYAAAVETKDYQTICDDLLSERLIEKLRSANFPCETAFKRGLGDVQEPAITVKRVKIDGDSASAVARTEARGEEPSEDTIGLVREDEKWKIVSLSSA
jgi:ketosteroid isomerase-like protein